MKKKCTLCLFIAFLCLFSSIMAQEKIAEFPLDLNSMNLANQVFSDITGNGHNAQLTGDFLFDIDRNNLENGAINLGSSLSNGIIINGENNPTDLGDLDQLTISFWFIFLYSTVNECDNYCERFLHMVDANGVSYDLEIAHQGRTVFKNNDNDINLLSLASDLFIVPSLWYHIALTIDKTNQQVKFYLNGDLRDVAEGFYIEVPQNPSILIGEAAQTSSISPTFCMDNLTFYREILAEEQIQILSNDLSTSIETLNTVVPIRLFPNPAKSERLYWDTPLEVTNAAIFNLTGQLMQGFDVNQNSINLSGLQPGTYVLKLQSEDGQVAFKKFIRQ